MADNNKDANIKDYEEKCESILDYNEVKFAALIDSLGNILAGGYKKGMEPPITPEQNSIMRMEIGMRVSKRRQFDAKLGHVKYTASRREKAIIMSLPIDEKAMMIITEPHINIDRFAFKIITKLGRQWGDYDAQQAAR